MRPCRERKEEEPGGKKIIVNIYTCVYDLRIRELKPEIRLTDLGNRARVKLKGK